MVEPWCNYSCRCVRACVPACTRAWSIFAPPWKPTKAGTAISISVCCCWFFLLLLFRAPQSSPAIKPTERERELGWWDRKGDEFPCERACRWIIPEERLGGRPADRNRCGWMGFPKPLFIFGNNLTRLDRASPLFPRWAADKPPAQVGRYRELQKWGETGLNAFPLRLFLYVIVK